jgi:hypothetical protein
LVKVTVPIDSTWCHDATRCVDLLKRAWQIFAQHHNHTIFNTDITFKGIGRCRYPRVANYKI